MPDSKDLVQRVAQEIEASKTTSATPPGQAKKSVDRAESVEAINQVFALFRLNYHNQYYSAYPDAQQLNQIKKLWLDALGEFPVEQLLRGARIAIETSDYLPTLNRMLNCCREGLDEVGLPSVRDAYVEACNAASPKSAQPWSHPAVYLAGHDSDWYFLANSSEKQALPVFSKHYDRYCTRVMRGEVLEIPAPAALEKAEARPLSKEEQLEHLRQLRSETGL